ncbi:MAG: hypothetical protein HFE63_09950 [Clostridiales bacterium]|nr:hypothetical protein [Clostridiales bacterium]
MKKIIALLLTLTMITTAAVSCGDKGTKVDNPLDFSKSYVYKDAVGTLATNWSPHTYQVDTDNYLTPYIRVGLYDFIFNDALNPVEGKEPFAGYKIVPEMAADFPVDVTEKVKAEHPEFNIPESATNGYAYTIKLNEKACWDDGTPINADTYVYSMKRLLDPELLNYRATDYYTGTIIIANAENYANAGRSIVKSNAADGSTMDYEFADFKKGADGVYTTPDGSGKVYFGVTVANAYISASLADYSPYFPEGAFEVLQKAANEDGYCPVTDETIEALRSFITSDIWGNEPEEYLGLYAFYDITYPEMDFSNVGIMKNSDYEITLVFGKSLAGFNLYYALTSNWIVKEDLYEANLKKDGDAWFSTYNTSVETTSSYGPYKLVSYQKDKSLRLERNENWYGYSDGKHIYTDPVDGEIYAMYQTSAIDCQVVDEASTRKMMFLSGQLMGYGLQPDDYASYRNSEYVHATPGTTVFFFIFNGYMDAIKNREANKDFDQTKYDLETMTLNSFRRAVAVTYDKELFATTVSPSRSGGYGLIGTSYIYDPDTGARYRDTEQAKQVLCDFYSVDTSKFATLDDAVDSITGYDPVTAKEYYKQAFDEAIAAGYITDNDGDGKSDQIVRIEYSLGEDDDFMTTTINYLNEKMNDVTAGTPFEDRVQFVKAGPYGNDWSTHLKAGTADTSLAGWNGSTLDPFSLTDLYTNPSYQYDANWFNASAQTLELEVNVAPIGEAADMQKIKMNLSQWSQALNGATVTVGGKDYNFGDGMTDVDTRLTILAGVEGAILNTYDYIPVLQDGSMALLSQQVYYVIDEYNPIIGRGGIAYLKYNYDETEWAEYVAANGGELKY